MLTRLGGPDQRALARGIGRILQDRGELFVFGMRFLPLVRIVKGLGALILEFPRSVREFGVKFLVEPGKSDASVLCLVAERMLVEDGLVILCGGNKLASGFVGASPDKQ